jgi:enoyl-CoA hydratase
VIGDRWTILIMREAFYGVHRYGEMVRNLGIARMANALEELDKVTVAAVDGFAVGGGLEITMACDFVVATGRARWGMPEVDVGITPGWGGTTRLAR